MPPIPPKERKPTINIRNDIVHLRTAQHPGTNFNDIRTGMRKLYEPFVRIQEMLDELFGANEELRQIILNILDADPLANWIFAHKFSGVDMGEKINNAVDSIPDQARGAFVIVQSGIYDINTPIRIQNRNNIWFMGFGQSTHLRPGASFPSSTPFFLLDGSTEIVLSDFFIDGQNAPSTIGPALYIDGSSTNPDINSVTVNRIRVENYPAQGITAALSASRSIHDLAIVNNIIRNHYPITGTSKNAIHVGGPGTKRRVLISGNLVEHDSTPSATVDGNGHGIFIGQGTIETVSVVGNVIEASHADGVSIYARPEGTEAVSVQDVSVGGNTIQSPRANGISVAGGAVVAIGGNLIRNPGTAADVESRRNGIFLTHGITGASTKVAGTNLSIIGNTIHDSDGDMINGIQSDCDAGFEASGVINANQITGYSGLDIDLIPTAQDKWVIEPSSVVTMEVPSDSLSTGDNQTIPYRFQLPNGYKFRLYRAILSVDTAPSGGSFTIDVRWINTSDVDQGTIFSPATLSVTTGNDEVSTFSFVKTTFVSGDRLEFDIDVVNGGTRPLLQLFGWLVSA